MRRHRTTRFAGIARAAILTAILAAGLGGCASMSEKMSGAMASMPAVGLPANAPERPAEKLEYPPVNDMPPPRTTAVLTGAEQQRLERELVAAREGQRAAAAPPAAPKPAATARKRPAPTPAPSAPVVPASSSRMIY